MNGKWFIGSALVGLLFLLGGCGRSDSAMVSCEQGHEKAKQEQFQQAYQLLTQCIDAETLAAEDRRYGYFVRAYVNSRLGKPKAAVADQEAAYAIDDERTYGDLINYTLYLREAGRLEQSLAAIHQARAMEQQRGELSMPVQYHLGWTLQEMGRHEEAVEAFTLGLPAQPDFSGVYYRRGLSYEVLGEKEQARADFERVAVLLRTPSRGNANEVDERLYRKKLEEYGIH